ncbi:MAG TPA: 2-C-methyl-D-erythritol 2,4-cyclodiphosphate synthase [Steroidobacteraceae bacterium]|nr:2-C-methyl-D-erythritol 2,4-cyclodiphosphate synthase [Steroidobacteraceae bacterium]
MAIRIGSGFDIHAFGPGDSLVLAGIRVPHTHGIVAHSDGDVLLHALVDALLGAAGLGDIGMHFPDSDPQWRGADSARFVLHARELLARQHYQIANADLTLLAQAPKIAPWREVMRERVAALLQIDVGCVNIKATTPEHLGFLGRQEGLAAMASVLIEQRS